MGLQDVMETTLALDNFRRACDAGRGAVFFSVARGKVAEGIDFDRHYGELLLLLRLQFSFRASVGEEYLLHRIRFDATRAVQQLQLPQCRCVQWQQPVELGAAGTGVCGWLRYVVVWCTAAVVGCCCRARCGDDRGALSVHAVQGAEGAPGLLA